MRNKSYLSRGRIVYKIKRAQNHSIWLFMNIGRDQWEKSIFISLQSIRKEASSPETSSFFFFFSFFVFVMYVCVFARNDIFPSRTI